MTFTTVRAKTQKHTQNRKSAHFLSLSDRSPGWIAATANQTTCNTVALETYL